MVDIYYEPVGGRWWWVVFTKKTLRPIQDGWAFKRSQAERDARRYIRNNQNKVFS